MAERDAPASAEHERLLRLLYQLPTAVVRTDAAGTIQLMNPAATRILVPLVGDALHDMLAILEARDPELARLCRAAEPSYGRLVDAWRVSFPREERSPATLSFTVERLDEQSLAFAFDDVSALVEQEARLRRLAEQQAVQRGRVEMASATLHDIGNAVAGLTAHLSPLLEEGAWREARELERLAGLFADESPALAEALGAKRAAALEGFASQLAESLDGRRRDLVERVDSVARCVAHVEEILAIQRRTARGGGGERPGLLDLREVAEDALALQQAALARWGVRVRRALGDSPARVRGDRTKLVQLVVNLLRNALEAFDRRGTDEARHLRVALDVSRGTGARGARLVVEDDGPGLPGGSGEALIEAGNSSKRDAGGLGLGHAREIARQHGGELTLENVEAGRGARATLFLPLHEEDDDA